MVNVLRKTKALGEGCLPQFLKGFWDQNIWKLLLVLFSHQVVSNSLQPHRLHHTRLPCPSLSPGVCSNSCQNSVIPFSCLQSFPASGSFLICRFFTSGGQSIGVSTSVLPRNIQDWSPWGWTGWISLQSKGLSTVFSSTTVWIWNSLALREPLDDCSLEMVVVKMATWWDLGNHCCNFAGREPGGYKPQCHLVPPSSLFPGPPWAGHSAKRARVAVLRVDLCRSTEIRVETHITRICKSQWKPWAHLDIGRES